jgi:chaperonin GroEL (HSP60 family)
LSEIGKPGAHNCLHRHPVEFESGKQYEDLLQSGVIDPTKVTRTTLQNAASIAGLLLTTESVVVERPEKDKAPAMPGGGGGGMGDMY